APVLCRALPNGQGQFNTPPPQRVFYEQWGHYHEYDPRNRPLESDRKPYDGYRSGVTPDPSRRRLIEDAGDLRCKEAIRQGLDEFITVNTNYGNVVGRMVYLHFWKNVTTFLGVPYARPPTREERLRFKPPQVPIQWGSRYALKYEDSCPQYIRYIGKDVGIPRTSEDCLYMNIFTPWAASKVRYPYPVMIYIHGGFFHYGSGNAFSGHMLAASQEVVVVTFNYRLGLLGYMATADNASAGNFGLLDQIQAINWVRENIINFNGDPDRITLFGPDAGAASAGLLAISPQTKKYVKRVIAQSGSAVADWALIRDPLYMRNTSVVAGYSFGCRTRHTYNLIECLKSRSALDLTATEVTPDVGWLAWGPVVDRWTRERTEQTVPDLPENLLSKNAIEFDPDFAYMSGVTRDEGSYFVFANEELKRNNYLVNEEILQKKAEEFVRIYNYTLDQESLIRAIKFMYMPWSDPNNLTLIRQGYIDMLTDAYFTAGNDKMVKLMLKNNVRTYMYALNYTIEGLNLPHWMGVPHDTEYLLASGAPFMDPRFFPAALNLNLADWTEADRNMSQLIMESWANFARYPSCRPGNPQLCGPTPYALFNTILWKPMDEKNLQYLSINSTNYTGYWQYMLTDAYFTAGNDKMVKLMLKNNVRTYMYALNYTIEGLNLPHWMGVPHDTEYLLASGAPFMDPRFFPAALNLNLADWTEADRNMSQLIMESWANFARYPSCRPGNPQLCGPTPYALFNTILWKPMDEKNLQYLSINSTNYTGY
ncbi:unnamed protein product, partial [Medioppia subpectinata]